LYWPDVNAPAIAAKLYVGMPVMRPVVTAVFLSTVGEPAAENSGKANVFGATATGPPL